MRPVQTVLAITIVGFAAMLLGGCGGMSQGWGSGSANDAATPYMGFEPIDPEERPYFLKYSNGAYSAVEWSTITTPEEKRALLWNEHTKTTVREFTGTASIQYVPVKANMKTGHYLVCIEYIKFRDEEPDVASANSPSTSNDKDAIDKVRVGVGLRVEADVNTFDAGVDISGLVGLGAAAGANKLSGTMTATIIGIDPKQFHIVLPFGNKLDETAIQTTMQAMAQLKTLLEGKNTDIAPQVLAVKMVAPPAGPVAITKTRSISDRLRKLFKRTQPGG